MNMIESLKPVKAMDFSFPIMRDSLLDVMFEQQFNFLYKFSGMLLKKA